MRSLCRKQVNFGRHSVQNRGLLMLADPASPGGRTAFTTKNEPLHVC